MKNSFRLLIILLLTQKFTQAQTVYAGNDGAMRFLKCATTRERLLKPRVKWVLRVAP